MSSRYPRIRKAYAGTSLVRSLDRVDAMAGSNRLLELVLVQYLDVLEAALMDDCKRAGAPGSLLARSLEAVEDVLEAFDLNEPEPTGLLH